MNWSRIALLGLALAGTNSFAADKITVFAAASLTNALNDVAKAYEDKTGVSTTLSYASSSTLARQIAQGAPVDIYLSANEKWMDYLAEQQAIDASSRKSLLENSLVMIAPTSYPADNIEITANWNLTEALKGTRLAMGDPNHVPAGMYAKESLSNLGLWPQAEKALAAANNVRSALLLVERQEANLGLVYKTDAMVSEKVKMVGVLPADSHTPITYPVAMIKGKAEDPQVKGFYDYLMTDEAAAIFEKYGFGESR